MRSFRYIPSGFALPHRVSRVFFFSFLFFFFFSLERYASPCISACVPRIRPKRTLYLVVPLIGHGLIDACELAIYTRTTQWRLGTGSDLILAFLFIHSPRP